MLEVLSSFIKTKLVCSTAELGLPGGLSELVLALAGSFPGKQFGLVELDKENEAHVVFLKKARGLVRGVKSSTLKSIARTLEFLYPGLPKGDALWIKEPTVTVSAAHQLVMISQSLPPIRSQEDLDAYVGRLKGHSAGTTDYELVAAVYYYVMHQANLADNQVMRGARVPFVPVSVNGEDASQNVETSVKVDDLMVAIRDALFRRPPSRADSLVGSVSPAGGQNVVVAIDPGEFFVFSLFISHISFNCRAASKTK